MSKISKEEEKQLRISPNMHPVPTNKKLLSANIPIIAYVSVVVLLIVGLVGSAKVMGWYGTSGKISSDGKAIVLSVNSTGADLKGWMTLDSFLKAYSITKQEFQTQFAITDQLSATTTLGELGEITAEAVGVETLREWVDAGHTLENSDSNSAGTTPSSAAGQPSGNPTGTPSATDENGDFLIKGRTTIQEVLDETKVSKAAFYKEFKLPATLSTSTGLAAIKESVPDFEVSLVQDWFDARK